MRILRLKVGKYKILENFEIDFEDNVSVFIGENGSGKSTILEVLLLIFREAHLQFVEKAKRNSKDKTSIPQPSDIEVDYQINLKSGYYSKNETVTLKLSRNGNDEYVINSVSDYSIDYLIQNYDYEKLLPQKIITYYAGWLERIKTFCTKHQEIYIKNLNTKQTKKNGKSLKEELVKNLFLHYIEKGHFDIIMGCFGAFEQNIQLEKFFNEDLNIQIQEEETINIQIQKGSLKGKNKDSFWNIEGDQLRFLNILKEFTHNGDFSQKNYDFNFNRRNWVEVKKRLGSERILFDNLNALLSLNMIASISTAYKKRGSDTFLHQNYLSEGEQQRLTIMGIHEFMANENALILLDEPDVFLHPKWQRDFIYDLSKEERPSNHYFITSHSPNILSGLKKEQIFALHKTGNSTEIKNIYFNSFGKPVDEILIDFFDVESLRYKEAQDQIDKVWALIKTNQQKEVIFKTEFEKLESMIGKSDSEITTIKLELTRKEKRNEKN
jgi:predicted ATP-dependent endonuclease of OLD family